MNHSRSVRGIYDDRNETRCLLTLCLREGCFPQKIWLFHRYAKSEACGPGREVVMEIIAPVPIALLHAASIHRVEASRAHSKGVPAAVRCAYRSGVGSRRSRVLRLIRQYSSVDCTKDLRRQTQSLAIHKKDVIEGNIECRTKNRPAHGPIVQLREISPMTHRYIKLG